jgi:hypothetical protein
MRLLILFARINFTVYTANVAYKYGKAEKGKCQRCLNCSLIEVVTRM